MVGELCCQEDSFCDDFEVEENITKEVSTQTETGTDKSVQVNIKDPKVRRYVIAESFFFFRLRSLIVVFLYFSHELGVGTYKQLQPI